jgi:hypothetical protein
MDSHKDTAIASSDSYLLRIPCRITWLRNISTDPMLKKNEFWILTALAAIALLLAIVNMVVFSQNRAAQAEVGGRSQYIQQAAQLEPLYREMVKALADLAVRNNDAELRDMLTKQGITLTPSPPAPTAPAPEPKKGK